MPRWAQPPITRWDYDAFSVYFENDHVIHAVVPSEPPVGGRAGCHPARRPYRPFLALSLAALSWRGAAMLRAPMSAIPVPAAPDAGLGPAPLAAAAR